MIRLNRNEKTNDKKTNECNKAGYFFSRSFSRYAVTSKAQKQIGNSP